MAPVTAPHWAGSPASLADAGAGPLVFVAALDDPALAPLLTLTPNAEDERDAARHGAVARPALLQRRALLRHLLARRLGCPAEEVRVAYDALGAPRLIAPEAELFLSVSGRAGFAAFGVSATPIGVDLEVIGPPEEPAWNVLHPSEREMLRALDPAERHLAFLRIWTMKEAWLKQQGLGLSVEPADLVVETDAGEWRSFTLAGTPLLVACAYG